MSDPDLKPIPTPKRRWSFSLRTLFVATTLIAALTWAFIETRKAEEFKADAKRLQYEKAFLETRIKTQEQLVHDIDEIVKKRQRARLIKGSVPDHWLVPSD
jgi:hypothetical protein